MAVRGTVALTALVVVWTGAAFAVPGPNSATTLPLHAVVDPQFPAPCTIDDPCDPGPPLVDIPAQAPIAAYLLIRNHESIAGVQTAFEWADWSLVANQWTCQSNQVVATEPHGNGGAVDGTIATAFDCIVGPQTAVVGIMHFIASASGCLTQVDSSFPFGTHVVSCAQDLDAIGSANRGAICVGSGGADACVSQGPFPPICDAGGPYSGETGTPVQFDGSASFDPDGTISSYSWLFGDGGIGFGPTPTHIYQTANVYTVTLCVIDDDGNEVCCNSSATITPAPLSPVCNPGGPYVANLGEPIDFDGTGSFDPDGVIVSYAWEFGDGETGVGPIVTHTYALADFYAVTLTVVDDDDRSSSCVTTAFVNGPPICDAGGPYFGIVCTELTLDGRGSNDPDGVIVSYAWEFGDGATASGPVSQHIYLLGGAYTVSLTVIDDLGVQTSCATPALIDDTHPPIPLSPVIGVAPAVLDFGCVDIGVCDDLTALLRNAANDPCSILEVIDLSVEGDGFSLLSPPPLPLELPGDGSTVTLTVRFCPTIGGNHDGWLTVTAASTSSTVPLVGVGNLAPLCDAGPPQVGDEGEPVQFDGSASSDPDGSIVAYEWQFGDGGLGSGAVASHVYWSHGLFTVTLTVTDNCDRTQSCTTNASISARPDCDAGGPYEGLPLIPVTFDGTQSNDPDGTIVSYEWEFGDGGTAAGAIVDHVYLDYGFYTVTLCVTDNDGLDACCDVVAWIWTETPVELVRFEGTGDNEVIHLNWRTGPSHAHMWFNVERSEAEREDFARVNSERISARGSAGSEYEFFDRSAVPGRTYDYRLESIDPRSGETDRSRSIRLTLPRVAPERLLLFQNRPNPFNPQTTIAFALPAAGMVRLRIYAASGRLVRTLIDGVLAAELHRVSWNGRDDAGRELGSGVYIYRVETAAAAIARRMVLLR